MAKVYLWLWLIIEFVGVFLGKTFLVELDPYRSEFFGNRSSFDHFSLRLFAYRDKRLKDFVWISGSI